MTVDVGIAIQLLSAVATIGTVVSLDRKRARSEGAKDQQFTQALTEIAECKAQGRLHETRINALESRCISWSDHEEDAVKCRAGILDKVKEVAIRQDEMDESREKARDADQKWKDADQRWKTNILVYLGRIASKLDIAPITNEST